MAYKVIIHKADGSDELFGEFMNEYWARYHTGIAHVSDPDNIYCRPEYEGSDWEIINMDERNPIIKDKDGDEVFISRSGIGYSILEGRGTQSGKASDIAYFMLDGYDCNTELVTWIYGASFLNDPDTLKLITDRIDKWESEHEDLVKDILSGEIRPWNEG